MKNFKVFAVVIIAVILSSSVTYFYNNKLHPDIAAKKLEYYNYAYGEDMEIFSLNHGYTWSRTEIWIKGSITPAWYNIGGVQIDKESCVPNNWRVWNIWK